MNPAFFEVVDLKKFQHYSKRNPPWIKLYASVLESYDFGRLHDASKAHAMLIWLLASRTDNRIPYDVRWVAQRIQATEPVDLDALLSAGFIRLSQVASPSLATRQQDATPETETETETEGETEKTLVAGATSGPDCSEGETTEGQGSIEMVGDTTTPSSSSPGLSVALSTSTGVSPRDAEFDQCYQFWLERVGPFYADPARLTPTLSRKKIFRDRRKAGYTVEQVRHIIEWAVSPGCYMHDNDRGKAYLDFDNLFGSDRKMDRYLAEAQSRPSRNRVNHRTALYNPDLAPSDAPATYRTLTGAAQ